MFGQLMQIERASKQVTALVSTLDPATQGRALQVIEAPQPYRPAELVPGRGKVLLVDSDESILEASGEMLRHLGYTVEAARDAEEASSVCSAAREASSPFQLAIIEVGGEEIDGAAIAARLVQENPGLRTLATSGQPSHLALQEPAAHGFTAALPPALRHGGAVQIGQRGTGSLPVEESL